MFFELLILGVITGFVSGFFGVGGGMFLVPLLLTIGLVMKEAIAISVMQMVFSSIYGSFLNHKKAQNVLKDGIIIGIGGFVGGLQSGYIVSYVSNEFLQYLFIGILLFSIIKIILSPAIQTQAKKEHNKISLFIIGFIIGILSMSIGIGGSVILTPILVSFLKYDLKSATALGLFFVIFSSIAGFVSLSLHGHMLFSEGLNVGIASLIGVYFGIKAKHIIHDNSYKKYIIILYIAVFLTMLYKTVF